ncbi:MAG: 50S ribosomal protein L17 [Phycisphaerae bacterium]|nr:50S ribosomal protein L17 [Phycisphaerae bacterium]
MRHGRAGYRLGRKTAHRTSTLRNLAAGLFEHGQIVTTIPKAKAVQPLVEKIITLAKRGDLAARRLVISKLGADRRGFEWLYLPKKPTEAETDRIQKIRDQHSQFFELPSSGEVELNRYGEVRKSPRLVKHIFERVAPKYADRSGGYTRIVKLGKWRIGDASELALLQLVGNEEGSEIGGNISTRRRIADRRTAKYAELREKAPQPG